MKKLTIRLEDKAKPDAIDEIYTDVEGCSAEEIQMIVEHLLDEILKSHGLIEVTRHELAEYEHE